jgi:hypothetical protein
MVDIVQMVVHRTQVAHDQPFPDQSSVVAHGVALVADLAETSHDQVVVQTVEVANEAIKKCQ